MKAPSLLYGPFVLLLFRQPVSSVFLEVSPDQQQFFTGQSVRLSCVGVLSSDEWALKRISVMQTETCGDVDFGKLNGSSCIISNLGPLRDRGVYWCEHLSGQKSKKITITVSDRPIIMEIPAHPVTVGTDVTLCCRARNGSTIWAHFFKFGQHSGPIKSSPRGEFTISNVQQSDEGFYWCSTDQNQSPSSKLSVLAGSAPPTPSSPLNYFTPFLKRLLCHLVVVSPYCLSTGLMVSIYCCRRMGNKPGGNMEMTRCNKGGQELEIVYVNDIAEVTIVHGL